MTKLTREQFKERLKAIKLMALDVDGVLTDNALLFGPDGFEMKRFNIADGFYMKLAMRAGLEIAIVSGRYSPATDTRMKELGVKRVMQGNPDKVAMLKPSLDELGITMSDVASVGDEILDLALARKVGLPIAVNNAAKELREIALYVTNTIGGAGAVREILECWFEAVDKNPEQYIY
ncbi:MAG: HAD hydrolase family protein [Candidatus Zixiibacteriota bacterium]